MPSSVRDRLTTSYEMLFLLVKQHHYYFDLDPIRIPAAQHRAAGQRVDGTTRRRGAAVKHGAGLVEAGAGAGNLRPTGRKHTAGHPAGRNPGDVWTIATRPYHGAHVAPFPIDLPLRAIAAGSPPGGLVCDPFSGAGTTGLAALRLGRRYLGIDVSAAALEESLRRLDPHLPADSGGSG